MAKVVFDFDRKLNEDMQTEVNLVSGKETKDDKIDFLKKFQDYWEFEKGFKYNSTFDTTFKKVVTQVGLDKDQTAEIMKDLIGEIVGNAAEKIGLKWAMINDGRYLFCFYKSNGSPYKPEILVPYDFKFSQLKDKIIDWLYDQKKQEIKKPKLQIVESLSSNITKKYKEKDTREVVQDIGAIDEEVANQFIKKFINNRGSRISKWAKMTQYASEEHPTLSYVLSGWWCLCNDGTWIFKVFDHEKRDHAGFIDLDNSNARCIYIKFENEEFTAGILESSDEVANLYPFSKEYSNLFFGENNDKTTLEVILKILNVFLYAYSHQETINKVFDQEGLNDVIYDPNATISSIQKAIDKRERNLIEFLGKVPIELNESQLSCFDLCKN